MQFENSKSFSHRYLYGGFTQFSKKKTATEGTVLYMIMGHLSVKMGHLIFTFAAT